MLCYTQEDANADGGEFSVFVVVLLYSWTVVCSWNMIMMRMGFRMNTKSEWKGECIDFFF